MPQRVYNINPIIELMNEWYSSEEPAHTLDEVLFFYTTKRMEEGCTCQEDVNVITQLKGLRDAFSKA